MAAELSISLLRALTPAQVRLFAVRAGWKVESRYSGPGTLLNHPTDKLTQFRLPGQIGDPDYAHRMRDAVEKLAATQGRPATELLYELSLPPADVLHLRLQTHDGENGTLPLDLGVRLVQSGRQLLSAAACSAVRPQAYFRSLSSGPVDKFLDRCRLGQTQNGTGYSTTFAALVTPDSQTTFADHVATSDTDESVAALIADASFERKVTLILMRAMHALRAVLDGGATDGFAKTVSHGVSANLCDALTELSVSDSRAQLEVSMGWSKALRQVPARLAERVTFSQPEFSFLQAGSRELKRLDSRPVTLRGPVFGLKAPPPSLYDSPEGEVTIRADIDGVTRTVRFSLPASEYKDACNAHRDGESVAVTGTLVSEAATRLFTVTPVTSFHVIAREQMTSGPT